MIFKPRAWPSPRECGKSIARSMKMNEQIAECVKAAKGGESATIMTTSETTAKEIKKTIHRIFKADIKTSYGNTFCMHGGGSVYIAVMMDGDDAR